MHHALFYDYVPDVLERRDPYRARHLALIREWRGRGELLAAGAFADPVDGALFLFAAPRSRVEEFLAADPYVAAGLVRAYRIRALTLVD